MLSALGTMFVEKKDIIKLSDAIKEVTSKGKDFYPSNGQTIKHQRPYASVCAELQESSIPHQSPAPL